MLQLNQILKSSRAAIDLASIMVGIIVIGLIGGVISATIFAVIPWSQDNAAKQQLDSIASAQSAYRGLSSDKDTQLKDAVSSPTNTTDPNQVVLNSTFTGSDGLAKNDLLQKSDKYCVIASADGSDYNAYSLSGSGKVFKMTAQGKETSTVKNEVTCLGTVTDGALPDSGSAPGSNPGTGTAPTVVAETNTQTVPVTSGLTRPSVSSDGSVIVATDSVQNSSTSVRISKDGGNTWTASGNGIAYTYPLSATVSGDGKTIYMARRINDSINPQGSLLKTTNFTSWVDTKSHQEIYANVSVSKTGSGVLANGSRFGYIDSTTNSGTTWTQSYGPRTVYGNAISGDGKTMAYSGIENTTKYFRISTDGGVTWKDYLSKVPDNLTSLAIDATGSTIIGIAKNQLMVSKDKGITWATIEVPGDTSATMAALMASDTGRIVVKRNGNTDLFVSDDGGITFSTVKDSGINSLSRADLSGDGTTIVSGTGNNIITVVKLKTS